MSQFEDGWSPLPGQAPSTNYSPPGDKPYSVVCTANGPFVAYYYSNANGMFGPIIAGPYSTVDEANAWIKAHPDACGAGAPAPAPPPGGAPAPPQPPPWVPPGAGEGGVCAPAPCLPAAPGAPDDAALAEGDKAAPDLTACLPGWAKTLAETLTGKSLRDLLIQWGYLDAQGRQGWAVRLYQYLQKQDSWWSGTLTAIGGLADLLSLTALNGIQTTGELMEEAVGCKPGTGNVPLALQALTGVWERWIGRVPEPLDRALGYSVNWACPNELPSQAEANRMWVTGVVTDDEWKCLTEAQGNDPAWQEGVVSAEEDYPTLTDVLRLEVNSGYSKETLNRLWRRAGVWEDTVKDYHRAAARFAPTPTDAVEWMGKDLSDPLLTQTFGLYNEFNQKFRGEVAEAFKMNRMDEKWARVIFASHRRGAAPHQMYEMHKRLRPGFWALLPAEDALHMAQAIAPRRPAGEGGLLEQASNLEFLGQQRGVNALYGGDPQALARFGRTVWVRPVVSPDPKIAVPQDLAGLPPQWLDEIGDNAEAARAFLAETVTSGFHVFEGLSQANYPPFWRARLLALSYNVMTRVDMRRAYETGQVDKETLFQKLQDRGYTPVDARHLADFYEVAATQLASRRPAVNSWVTDGYEISLLQQALLDQGMRPEMWPAVRRAAETRRQIYVQQRCIRHLKKLVIAGLVEEPAVAPRLLSIGLTGPEAARLSSEWQCERRSIPKPESAAQVCSYLKMHLIGPALAVRLVHRLGYTYPESRRIVNGCLLKPLPKGTRTRGDLAEAMREAERLAPPEEGGLGEAQIAAENAADAAAEAAARTRAKGG